MKASVLAVALACALCASTHAESASASGSMAWGAALYSEVPTTHSASASSSDSGSDSGSRGSGFRDEYSIGVCADELYYATLAAPDVLRNVDRCRNATNGSLAFDAIDPHKTLPDAFRCAHACLLVIEAISQALGAHGACSDVVEFDFEDVANNVIVPYTSKCCGDMLPVVDGSGSEAIEPGDNEPGDSDDNPQVGWLEPSYAKVCRHMSGFAFGTSPKFVPDKHALDFCSTDACTRVLHRIYNQYVVYSPPRLLDKRYSRKQVIGNVIALISATCHSSNVGWKPDFSILLSIASSEGTQIVGAGAAAGSGTHAAPADADASPSEGADVDTGANSGSTNVPAASKQAAAAEATATSTARSSVWSGISRGTASPTAPGTTTTQAVSGSVDSTAVYEDAAVVFDAATVLVRVVDGVAIYSNGAMVYENGTITYADGTTTTSVSRYRRPERGRHSGAGSGAHDGSTTPLQASGSPPIVLILGSIIAVLAAVVVVLAMVARWRGRKKNPPANMTRLHECRTRGGTVSQMSLTTPHAAYHLGVSSIRGQLHSTSSVTSMSGSLCDDEELQSLYIPIENIKDVRLIGCGGYGVVYLVKHRGCSDTGPSDRRRTRFLASKRLVKSQLTREKTRAFIDEIKLVAKLQHPSVVALAGVAWTTESDLQALFEYMAGGDLRSHLDAVPVGKWPWDANKLQVALDVADALAYVHAQTINGAALVHRDLKSRNVLLSATASTSIASSIRAKLSDFGVSRFESAQQSMTTGVGTSRWLAPEVIIGGGQYDASCDVYAFGVLLSELDTHCIPFSEVCGAQGGALPDVMILQLVSTQRQQPRFASASSDDTVGGRVVSLARRCMSFKRRDRPSAGQVASDLRALLFTYVHATDIVSGDSTILL